MIYKFRYFEFSIDDWKKSRLIFILPRGHMLIEGITVRVEEAFSTVSTVVTAELLLGTVENVDSIARALVTTRGVLHGIWSAPINPADSEFLRVQKKDTPIYLIVSGTGSPTKGRGWGIIKYLNMHLVEGYK
jgi:hypothetical protein